VPDETERGHAGWSAVSLPDTSWSAAVCGGRAGESSSRAVPRSAGPLDLPPLSTTLTAPPVMPKRKSSSSPGPGSHARRTGPTVAWTPEERESAGFLLPTQAS
jgi:hypothetical protein